jgi:hypothetical protein
MAGLGRCDDGGEDGELGEVGVTRCPPSGDLRSSLFTPTCIPQIITWHIDGFSRCHLIFSASIARYVTSIIE